MTIRKSTITALALATTLSLAGCTSAASEGTSPHDGQHTSAASASTSTEFNDADVMFASMMIVHHQQAVEMSEILLANTGVDADVAALAQDIKDAQEPEIATLKGWLDDWGVDANSTDTHSMDHGDGMMSDDDLAQLEAADGDSASALYLEQMIAHHEGAVAMAETEVDTGLNGDAVELAQQIIDAQSDEIEQMRDMLAAL